MDNGGPMNGNKPTYEELEELAWLGASLMAAVQFHETNPGGDGRVVIAHSVALQQRYLAYLEKRLGDQGLDRYAREADAISARIAERLGLPIVTIRWGASG